jgi:serine/threonine protein kinase
MEAFHFSTDTNAEMLFHQNSPFVFYSLQKRYLTILNRDNEITSDEKSIVTKCYDYHKKRPAIVKIINREIPDSGDEFLPAKVSHPNIIRYEWIEKTPTLTFIYMKKYKTDLIDFFGEEGKEEYILPIFKKMCSAVEYLHTHHIAHFDIKLENYLMDEHMNVVLTDFGFAMEWVPPEPHVSIFKGSWYYVAPEVISRKSYLITKPDIWALGICLFAMLNDRFPFVKEEPRISIRNKTEINYSSHTTAKWKEILENIIVEEYMERPTIQKIQEWLK